MNLEDHTHYPSSFAIGDTVNLDFEESGFIKNAVIEGVRFTESKVWYSVRVFLGGGDDPGVVLYDVDSYVVKKLSEGSTKGN